MQRLEMARRLSRPLRQPRPGRFDLYQERIHANRRGGQYFFGNGLKPAASRSAFVLPALAASSGPTSTRTVSSFGPGASRAVIPLFLRDSTTPPAAVFLGAATCR